MAHICKQVMAQSFADTVMAVDGVKEWDGPEASTTSPLLTALGWKAKYNLQAWASDPKTLMAFKRAE